jgi:hypothetical protein
MKQVLAAVVSVAVLGASPALAQTGRAARVLALPAGAQAAAMGNAFLLDGDSRAVFYNPAGLDSAGGAGVDVARYGSSGSLASASAAAGPFGFGVQVLSYGTASPDPRLLQPGDVALRSDGAVSGSEMSAAVGYARKLWKLRVGATARFVQERVGDTHDQGWAADVGATLKAGPAVLGIAGRSLGPDLTLGGRDTRMPMALRLDAAVPSQEVGPLDVAGAATLTVAAGARVMPGAGVQVGYYPIEGRTFAGRAGVRRGYGGEPAVLTLGGGLQWDKLAIDYAYEGLRGGPAHRIGLTWR